MVIRKDEIVISGISCRLPESENIEEFKEHLMNKDDMVTDDDRRWPPGYYGLPNRHAKLKDIKSFDAAFFGVSPKQAHMMDPQLRLLLEVAYEAILDAGLNPQDMRGTKTGVFVGCSNTETQDVLIQDPETVQGYSLTGCQHSMFANRLSFSFDFKGPSFSVDTACSSSLLAFQLAVDSIRQGSCDAALVCGTHLTMRPTAAMQFLKLSMLSPQGKCQSFDANGDGYVRAEGVVAVLLQKESETNRIYAEVVHAKSNVDGFKEQGITFPNGNEQANLLRAVYTEAGVEPADVYYVECHGTGTKVGDPQEANAVAEVLCKNRKTPLLIGSVKSNMGHAEPSSGLASMCKLMIAMESGYIAPNLHFREPNPNIPALLDGRMKVVTEKTPIDAGIIGINSFGFGGANTHVIL
uniref:Fatty acid synthase n=1 Tax=Romanomermis culicivorax TaxID=13658 RepID=A0A915JP73_ROMCU